jgi:hypothetical protein
MTCPVVQPIVGQASEKPARLSIYGGARVGNRVCELAQPRKSTLIGARASASAASWGAL